MNLTMPVVFLGHGSPMNAIEDNRWARGFKALGRELPRPEAVLCVSAHWYLGGTLVTTARRPRTIHDFGGFPRELYDIAYPAPGSPELAAKVADLLSPRCQPDAKWGLDHGAWTVLRHLFPEADVPVVQLSIDEEREPAVHFEIGRRLAGLRAEGVMILGSGNIVHNLADAFSRGRRGDETTPEWAARFDAMVERAVREGDSRTLVGALDGREGPLAHPTPDHYLPLLYCAGAAQGLNDVSFPLDGFDFGSLSMRGIVWAEGKGRGSGAES